MKNYICTAAGVIGAGIANIFGGWSAAVSGAVKNDLFLNISSWVVFKLMSTGIWIPQSTLAN